MKKLWISLITLIGFVSCQKENTTKDYILFSGTITNPFSKKIVITDTKNKQVKTINLSETNQFSDTLRIEKGYYNFSDGRERSSIYLAPSFDLNLSLDTKEFDETIVYKGKGASENNFLAKKYLMEEETIDYKKISEMPEKDFLNVINNYIKSVSDLLNKSKDLDSDFKKSELTNLKFNKSNFLSIYPRLKSDYRPSPSYPNPFGEIDFEDQAIKSHPNYQNALMGSIAYQVENTSDKTNKLKNAIEIINKKVTDSTLRSEFIFNFGSSLLPKSKNLDTDIELLKKEFPDTSKKLNKLVTIHKTYSNIQKGMPSPVFTFEDINGKAISLNDLKGHVVYIDFWATWCGPCKGEIPFLKTLEEKFHGRKVKFVSICVWDEKDKWQSFVKEKQLGGIQLFAPEKEKLTKQYGVNGIPRFVLLDQNGNIVENNALRPSSETKIENQIMSLL